MRTLREIWAFAFSKPEAYAPAIPSPYEVALAISSALIQTAKYENPDAAISAAWWAVPSYYQGAGEYNRVIAPALLFGIGPSEGEQMQNTEFGNDIGLRYEARVDDDHI